MRNNSMICAAMLMLLGAGGARAEYKNRWEFTAFGGHHFSGHLELQSETNPGQVDVTDGSSFGIAVGRDIAEDSAVEVMWTRQNSSLRTGAFHAPSEDIG